MSIHKIQRSMEMILEGVDSLDVSLIMEANGEFKKGFASLKDNLTGFIGVCKPFGELSDFTSGLEKSLESINAVESNMDKISSEYSFTDHYKMQNPSKDESEKPPEAIVSSVALEYPTYVAALRDAILEIAKWLEEYSEVFSVGKNGIVFSEKFRSVIKNNDLKIKDFGQSGDEIIAKMSGINEVEQNKSHFESIWKSEDLEEDKYDEAWNKFVAVFDTIGQGASGAHDSATNIIKGAKPPEDVQNKTKESGGILQTIIGALFGGKKEAGSVKPISQNPKLIVGASLTDEKGIFAMSFQDLQKLIASVIEFSGTSSAAGAQALAGIDSQQQEAMKPNKDETAVVEKIKDVSPKVDNKIVTQTGAAMEQSGMKDGDTSKIDSQKLKKLLMDQFGGDEAKVNAILVGLELDDTDAEEEADAKSPLDVITDLRNVGDDFKDEVIDTAMEEELMGEDGEASPPNDPEAVDDVIEMVDDELDDDEQGELRDAFNSKNETVLRENINRWSKLAGIINE